MHQCLIKYNCLLGCFLNSLLKVFPFFSSLTSLPHAPAVWWGRAWSAPDTSVLRIELQTLSLPLFLARCHLLNSPGNTSPNFWGPEDVQNSTLKFKIRVSTSKLSQTFDFLTVCGDCSKPGGCWAWTLRVWVSHLGTGWVHSWTRWSSVFSKGNDSLMLWWENVEELDAATTCPAQLACSLSSVPWTRQRTDPWLCLQSWDVSK